MDRRTETTTRSAWIEVDGLWTHYLPAEEAGSPVLHLHGGGLDSASLSWKYTIGPITRQRRVFAPDWPGFGRSDSPRTPWAIQNYITFLGHFVERVGLDRASLVGISLGGAIAIGFALRSPERVAKLVLVDSYGLGGEVPGGWTAYLAAYLFVRLPLVTELMWTVLGRSRRLARKTLESFSADPRRSHRNSSMRPARALDVRESAEPGVRSSGARYSPAASGPTICMNSVRSRHRRSSVTAPMTLS